MSLTSDSFFAPAVDSVAAGIILTLGISQIRNVPLGKSAALAGATVFSGILSGTPALSLIRTSGEFSGAGFQGLGLVTVAPIVFITHSLLLTLFFYIAGDGLVTGTFNRRLTIAGIYSAVNVGVHTISPGSFIF